MLCLVVSIKAWKTRGPRVERHRLRKERKKHLNLLKSFQLWGCHTFSALLSSNMWPARHSQLIPIQRMKYFTSELARILWHESTVTVPQKLRTFSIHRNVIYATNRCKEDDVTITVVSMFITRPLVLEAHFWWKFAIRTKSNNETTMIRNYRITLNEAQES